MEYFNDVMCDLETGGTSPDHSPIIQLSAVKFDLKTRRLASLDLFDRCLFDLPGRYWDESTRDWWMGKNAAVLRTILPRREQPRVVFENFVDWVLDTRDPSQPLRFWSRPVHFDYPMLESHFKQLGILWPFHYRSAMDMNSYIRGLGFGTDTELYYAENTGPAHNAIVDTLNQIGNLFAAQDHHENLKNA